MPLTTLKMATLAPMPSARVRTAMPVNAGALTRRRSACLISMPYLRTADGRGFVRVASSDRPRQRKPEGGAGAGSAARPDPAALCLDQRLDDGETEAAARGLALARGVGAVKALEGAGQLLFGEAAAAVGHLDEHLAAGHPRPDVDVAAGRSVARGVGQQVDECLPQTERVGQDRERRGDIQLHSGVEIQAGGAERRS